MTTIEQLEKRMSAMEQRIDELQRNLIPKQGKPGWLQHVMGRHDGDPAFKEVIRLGREFRESQRCDDNG